MTDFRLTSSIYCENLDGECFDFRNCFKCPYKPAEIIPEREAKRIAEDAGLAIDALCSIKDSSSYLHQNYLKEKLSVVKRCVAFMEHYVKGENKDG